MASDPTPADDLLSPENLKRALKAFKKRLKLTRLDDESNYGGNKLTGGRSSSVVGITPPDQYPKAVWEELARLGRIRSAGHGMFELVEP